MLYPLSYGGEADILPALAAQSALTASMPGRGVVRS